MCLFANLVTMLSSLFIQSILRNLRYRKAMISLLIYVTYFNLFHLNLMPSIQLWVCIKSIFLLLLQYMTFYQNWPICSRAFLLEWCLLGFRNKEPQASEEKLMFFLLKTVSLWDHTLGNWNLKHHKGIFKTQASCEWDMKWISCALAPWSLVTIDKAKSKDEALLLVGYWAAELITES